MAVCQQPIIRQHSNVLPTSDKLSSLATARKNDRELTELHYRKQKLQIGPRRRHSRGNINSFGLYKIFEELWPSNSKDLYAERSCKDSPRLDSPQ